MFIPTVLAGGGLFAAQASPPVAGPPWPVASTTALSSGALTAPLDASWTPGRSGFLFWVGSDQRSSFNAIAITAAGTTEGKPVVLRPPSGGAAWTPSRTTDPGGRALLVSYSASRTSPIQTAALDRSGKLTHRQRLPTRNRETYACSDMASDGSAVIAWPERTGDRWMLRRSVRTGLRQRFSTPRTIASSPVSGLSCSAAPRGRWLVATTGRASARSKADPRLHAFVGEGTASPRRLDLGKVLNASVPATAIDGRGRGFVLWRGQAPDAEQARPWSIRARSISPAGRATAPQKLAEGFGESGMLQLAASPTGGAIATITVTTETDRRNQAFLALAAGTSGRFLRAQPVGSAPAAPGDLRYDDDGRAAISGQSGATPENVAGLLVDGRLAATTATGGRYDDTVAGFTPEGKLVQIGIAATGSQRQLETRIQP